jgi:tartrate dehydrogenase/decarboxylase/D-malate dehydrogenase
MTRYRIAVIAGDGIGQEVMPEGQKVVEAAARTAGTEIVWQEFDWNCDH